MATNRIQPNRFFLEIDSLLRVDPYDPPGEREKITKGKKEVAAVTPSNTHPQDTFELVDQYHHTKRWERLV